jgi:uncharacterized protein (TIGR00369 family)
MSVSDHPSPPAPRRGTLPWTKSCFVCGEANPHGLRLRSRLEGDCVALNYTPRAADRGYREIVHGGITMTLLDEVMTWAAIVAAKRMCVAAELTVRLLHPIAVGTPLRFEGRVTRPGARLILTAGAARDAAGNLVAQATGKYAAMRDAHVAPCAKDFVVGPEAIPIADILETTAETPDSEAAGTAGGRG